MEIRYSSNQRDFKRYTTEETRKEFLIENLYEAILLNLRRNFYGNYLQ